MPSIFEHQQRALDRFIAAETATAPPFAIILGGSIAKGWHSEQSDVDLLKVVPDKLYNARAAAGTSAFWDERFLEGGCGVDIKYVTLSYLHEAAERGNEPTRAAFRGATVEFADSPARRTELEALIARATDYPEAGVEDRIVSYLGQVEAMRWYTGEAAKRDDPYLACWVAARAVLFGGRALLAHNRVLFPFHKWHLHALETCAIKPVGITDLARTATRSPSKANVEAFCDAVLACDFWPGDRPGWGDLFIRDTEWSWRTDPPRLEDG